MTAATLSSALLVLAGLVNLAPVIGVISAARVESLYGVTLAGRPDLEILLRHRAVLFGLLGAAMLYGAFDRDWFWPALGFGLVSMIAYAVLSAMIGGYGSQLKLVLTMDVIGVAFALAAAGARLSMGSAA